MRKATRAFSPAAYRERPTRLVCSSHQHRASTATMMKTSGRNPSASRRNAFRNRAGGTPALPPETESDNPRNTICVPSVTMMGFSRA